MTGDLPERLKAAVSKRKEWALPTNAERLVNGQGDALDGLVIDRYGAHFSAQVFYPLWLEKKEVLCQFVREQGGEYFILKDRSGSSSSIADAIGFEVLMDGGVSRTVVEEYGLKFEVDLNDGLNAGLFLDMRANRKLVAGYTTGKKVFNGFAYTCSFGVHARAAGAAQVVNVDISKKTLERGRRNYELNGIVPSSGEFMRADAVEYLTRAVKKENLFDVIILDPPSFARHEKGVFSVRRDMTALVATAVNALRPKGVLFVATNFSEMSCPSLEKIVRDVSGKKVKSVKELGQDQDFTGSGLVPESYLAAVLVELA